MALRLGDLTFGITATTSGLKKAEADLKKFGASLDQAIGSRSKIEGPLVQRIRQFDLVARELRNSANKISNLSIKGAPQELINKITAAQQELTAAFAKNRKNPLDLQESTAALNKFRNQIATVNREFAELGAKGKLAGGSAGSGADKAEMALARLTKTLSQVDIRVSKVNANLRKFGTDAAEKAIKANTAAARKYKAVLNDTSSTVLQLAQAEAAFNAVLARNSAALSSNGITRYQRDIEKTRDTVFRFEQQVETLNSRIASKGGDPNLVRQNSAALADFTAATTKFGVASTQAKEAQRVLQDQLRRTKLELQGIKSDRPVNNLALAFKNLATSTTLALGPLSGVGARINAISASLSRSGAPMAAFIAAATAAGVAIGTLVFKAGKAGIELSRLRSRFEALQDLGGKSPDAAFAELGDLAEKAGTRFLTTAEGFTKLEAAAAGTSLEGAKLKNIYEDLIVSASRFQLTNDQLGGTLRAFEQIISKGTVQAEELRNQLGDRLPGAFQIAARAMGVTTKELNRMLKAGEVTSEEFLPKFAAELRKTFGEVDRVENISASFARLANAELALSRAADEAFGITDKLVALIEGATSILKTVAENFQQTANAVKALAKAITTGLVTALGLLAAQFAIVRGLVLTSVFIEWTISVYNTVKAVGALTIATNIFNTTVKSTSVLLARVPWLGVAIAVAAVTAAVVSGTGAFKKYTAASTEQAKKIETLRKELEAYHEEQKRRVRTDEDGNVIELTPLEEATAKLQEIRKQLANYRLDLNAAQQQYEVFSKELETNRDPNAVAGIASALAKVENNLKTVTALVDKWEEYEKDVRIQIQLLTQEERKRRQEIERTGSALNTALRRQVKQYDEVAKAVRKSEFGEAEVTFGQSLEEDTRSALDAIRKEFGVTEDAADEYIATVSKVRNIFRAEGKENAFGDFLKSTEEELTKNTDKLDLYKSAVNDFFTSLSGARTAEQVNVFRDINRELERTQKTAGLIGKSKLSLDLLENSFSVDDTIRGFISSLVEAGQTEEEARANTEALRQSLQNFGAAKIKFEVAEELKDLNRELQALKDEAAAASSGSISLRLFQEEQAIIDQIEERRQANRDLFEDLAKAEAATNEYALALRNNAEAQRELNRELAFSAADREVERMLALADATLRGRGALLQLEQVFARDDAIIQYADSIRDVVTSQEEFNQKIREFAQAFDAAEGLKRVNAGVIALNANLEEATTTFLDGFTDAFARMIATADFSLDTIASLVQQLAIDLNKTFLELALTNPLKNLLFGQDLPTFAGQGASVFGIFSKGKPDAAGVLPNAAGAISPEVMAQLGLLGDSAAQAATTLGQQLSTQAAQAASQIATQVGATTLESTASLNSAQSTLTLGIASQTSVTPILSMAFAAQTAAAALASLSASGGVSQGLGLLQGFGGITQAARGGVMSGPTFFPAANVIGGEAGPEALLPLTRMADGTLGVKANGGKGKSGGSIVFGDINITFAGEGTPSKSMIKRSAKQLMTELVKQVNSSKKLTGRGR